MMAVVWSVAARQEIFSIIFLSFPSGGFRHHPMNIAEIGQEGVDFDQSDD
jgi:hypothetical protein